MPIPMIAAGITRVHQKSGEFFLKIELSKFVFMFICSFCFLSGKISSRFMLLRKQPILSLSKFHRSRTFLVIVRHVVDATAYWVAPHE